MLAAALVFAPCLLVSKPEQRCPGLLTSLTNVINHVLGTWALLDKSNNICHAFCTHAPGAGRVPGTLGGLSARPHTLGPGLGADALTVALWSGCLAVLTVGTGL